VSDTKFPCAVCELPACFFVSPDPQGRTRFCGEHFYTIYKAEAVPTSRRGSAGEDRRQEVDHE